MKEKENLMKKIGLQFFADGGEGQTEQTETETQPKTYTQEELDEILQRETDKRVTQALKTANKKQEEKLKEAQRLASMNEQQKYEYELAQREQAIAEKEKALALAENKNVASGILAEKGISLALVDFVVDENADVMNDRIKLLEKEFKKSVTAEVQKRLGGNPPPATTQQEEMTKEKFKKLSLMEQNKIATENPELYKQFTS